MEPVPILMMYGGQWKVRSNGAYVYSGGDSKSFTIERNCTFDEFIMLICEMLNWDLSVMKISLRAQYSTAGIMPPTRIETDSDLRFFVNDNIRHPERYTPLAVTVEERHNGGNGLGNPERRHCSHDRPIFRSASGSNQLSTPSPVVNLEAIGIGGANLQCRASSKRPVLIEEEECPTEQHQSDDSDSSDDSDNSDVLPFSYVHDPNFAPIDIPVEGPVDVHVEGPVDLHVEGPVDVRVEGTVDVPVEGLGGGDGGPVGGDDGIPFGRE
jgi:hypothetical protein